MTKDVIALTPRMPDTWALLAGLYAGGPDLDVTATADGAVIQLCGHGGRPVVSVEAPVLVQVPGEIARLLGTEAAAAVDTPVWWTETRASTAVPEAERLAGSVVGRLTALLGGASWPPGATALDVVPVTSGLAAVPAPSDALPAVDVVTDSTAVVLADRRVIPLTAWLSDVLRTTANTNRALQIVTPPHAQLSLLTRMALSGAPNRWVVQDTDCGYYDGLSGAVLRWQEGTFAPARTQSGAAHVARAFSRVTASKERQLTVSFRTRYDADDDLLLGRSLETAWQLLTGAPPVGWGTAEPVNLPWSTRQLTDLARSRVPEPTLLTAVGHPDRPAIANARITRTTAGVEEDITLTLGYGPGETVPLDAVEALAAALVAQHSLTTMLTTVRPARRDLAVPSHFESPPVPVAFTLGADAVADTTLTHARRPPLPLRPVQLGPSTHPALHYVLGDGTNAETWSTLDVLTQHLKAATEPV
ncbi:hypothetical protein FBY35_5867 [Streptomyces sp. SLBN-118]|uniref:DUF6177 family protein n=1 Tax=Streptomyces sp. SLBN-118 TaxID=2768454 RepID=UPI00114DCA9F|nr:DUF6177 family protein [Streptomyces sp. SLBN-118]TQK44364.1 hypothetical protein FBY35_5867 [Streptomyces sp. SLBN-118]